MPFLRFRLLISFLSSSLFYKYPSIIYNSTFPFFAMKPPMAKIISDFLPFTIISCAFDHKYCHKLAGSMAPTCRAKAYDLLIFCLPGIVHITLGDRDVPLFPQITWIPFISFFDLAKCCISS